MRTLIFPSIFTARSQKVPRICCSLVSSLYLSNPKISASISLKSVTVSASETSFVLCEMATFVRLLSEANHRSTTFLEILSISLPPWLETDTQHGVPIRQSPQPYPLYRNGTNEGSGPNLMGGDRRHLASRPALTQ